MGNVKRVYVEKKPEYAVQAKDLYHELAAKVPEDRLHLIGDAVYPANVMEAIWNAFECAIEC